MSQTKYLGIVPDENKPGSFTLLNNTNNVFYGTKEQIDFVLNKCFSDKETCAVPLLSITSHLNDFNFRDPDTIINK